MYKNNSICIWN